jgi:hypothetical protein
VKNYKHEICIDEDKKLLEIYRILSNGEKHLYTSVTLPEISANTDCEAFDEFSRMLGEGILIDSPAARRIFSMEKNTKK